MKIDCSRQLCNGQTDGQTDRRTDTHCDSLGSLTEPKMECGTPIKSRRPLNVTAVFNASSLTTEEVEMKRKELYQKNDGVWICLVCDYDTKDGSNIKKHVEKHIGGLSYPCTLCSKEFKSRVTFYRHMHKGH